MFVVTPVMHLVTPVMYVVTAVMYVVTAVCRKYCYFVTYLVSGDVRGAHALGSDSRSDGASQPLRGKWGGEWGGGYCCGLSDEIMVICTFHDIGLCPL